MQLQIQIRLKTQEVFTVNKSNYQIGKEKSNSDLIIKDNKYISRKHAYIVCREKKYYIIDNNSTNRTYVNGTVIPSEKEIEITSGTNIRIGNEEFIFRI